MPTTTNRQKTYVVYVADSHGWEIECPDYESVFFGYPKEEEGYRYVHPVDGGSKPCGHVVVTGHRKAVAFRDSLTRNPDSWASVGEHHTIETIAVYAIREYTEDDDN